VIFVGTLSQTIRQMNGELEEVNLLRTGPSGELTLHSEQTALHRMTRALPRSLVYQKLYDLQKKDPFRNEFSKP
ncbi:MAG: hypothetical protein PVH84_13405, partial [Candidatus Aminicenantes bacterium]